jgi:hypothetical protein
MLFALNSKCRINEKGALEAARRFPSIIADLTDRAPAVWCKIGLGEFASALETLRSVSSELRAVSDQAQPAAARSTNLGFPPEAGVGFSDTIRHHVGRWAG